MLVVVQQPIIDARSLLETETGRIRAADMRFPQSHAREFVRGLGPVEQRLRRGIDPWVGEGYYVDARHGVRFASTTQWCEALGDELKPVFRRLYSDGTVGRLEIGLRTPWLVKPDANEDPNAVAVAALRLPVRVGAAATAPFLDAGEPFAALLLRATTYSDKSKRPGRLEQWWVTAGSPLVLCELELDEAPTAAQARLRHALVADSASAVVEQLWLTLDGRRVSLWLIVSGTDRSPAAVRQLRIHVSRLHAEHEGFRTVLRLCETKRLDSNSEMVLDYINERGGQLLRRTFGGFPQGALLDVVLDRWEASYRNDLAAMRTVEGRLAGRTLQRKLEGVAQIAAGLEPSDVLRRVQINIFNGGNPKVSHTDRSNSISGTIEQMAGVQVGDAGTQTIGSINQTSNDLSKLADELVDAVAQLRGKVDDDDATEASDLATTIKDEAQKPEPDKSKIKRVLGKLVAIGKKVGPPALTVLSTAAAIAALL
jgi:polyhydroxyalkanoate synthesis regulator phasin